MRMGEGGKSRRITGILLAGVEGILLGDVLALWLGDLL
jgi:hypothetical protein